MSLRYAKYRSIAATGASSWPRTVHDSRDETGEITRTACIVPPRALPPGRLQITTSTTQNWGPQYPVSDIDDTAGRTPDNNEVGVPDALPVLAREPQVDRQRVAVGEQTAHRRRVGLAPTFGERIDAVLGDGHRLEPGRDAVGEIEDGPVVVQACYNYRLIIPSVIRCSTADNEYGAVYW